MSLLNAILRRGRAGERDALRTTSVPPAERAPAAPAAAVPRVVGPADAVLYGTVIALIAFGVVMVFSASSVFASQRYDNGFFFLVRQGAFALVALPMMVAIARVDYHRYRPFTYPLLAGVVALMLVTALGFGHSAGGAARWIAVGPVHIQPAEMAKVALIFWLAHSLSKKREKIRTFSVGFLPHVIGAGVLVLLCLKQPDFGSAVMIGLLTFILLFTAGARLGYILGAGILAAPLVYALVMFVDYRRLRMTAFLDPFGTRQGAGYQVAESLLSFGSGGLGGVGIGDSRQKLFYLPEAHTDFISAIIGEELGFIGLLVLIGGFLIVFWRGIRAAVHAADEYGTLLAVGITMFLGMQAFTNLAVAMGMLPTKGLVLPFISYGGSSLLVNSAAVGVLLNVTRPREAVGGGATTRRAGEGASSPRALGVVPEGGMA
ncbi:MAG: putative lipid II flippase FtsW [Sandaracinaceae bacterium]|nr:putative lipid II flippase FtsW [Sandaracinaceae bacterium]